VLTVRLPADSERPSVSELILQSDCGTLPALFGERVRRLLDHLQSRHGNPYSASNILVVAEEPAEGPGEDPGGGVAAAMVGYLAAQARAQGMRTAVQLARWYGPAVIVRLPRLARAGGSMRRLAPDDFYLAHIAVRPHLRGRGIGARLLGAAEERARRLGAKRVVLDVEEHNDGARTFYDRQGYRRESVVRIELGRHGTFSLLRLARQL
jgi:ribosomal protein S18 acetylase RimI-like enzyme